MNISNYIVGMSESATLPGSARAPRAKFGALAELIGLFAAGTPQITCEAHALPGQE